jgi:alpha-L-rhamnosidase
MSRLGIAILSITGGFALTVHPAPAADADFEEACVRHVLTPASPTAYPVAVIETGGVVDNPDGLVGGTGVGTRLRFPRGGVKPYLILDFGKSSVGGYTVFRVRSREGAPTLRLAYSCFRGACGERGGFERGSCTYLGVELPVLPANPGRFELYTIPRTGEFIAPLLQGQSRWVRVQLDSEGTEVELESLCIANHQTHDLSPQAGFFLSDDPRINTAWYASTWTLQLASFPNHNAWTAIHGWLIPRKLEQAGETGLCRVGAEWGDYSVEFDLEIRANPYTTSGAGWAVRAQDPDNGYFGFIDLDGVFSLTRCQDGEHTVLSRTRLDVPVVDGQRCRVRVEVVGDRITTSLDGVVLDETRDRAFSHGRIGFRQPKEAWALFSALRVRGRDGETLFEDDFREGLDRWEFAKRDRLVWSGDLDWAGRNVYYAFRDASYMADSIRMLAFNQTPEGYVHASPYPENAVPPVSGDYGPFPSDEFSAWLVPVAWDYYLYTGDRPLLAEVYPAVVHDLDYLLSYVADDGLFHQRLETSKHAENLELGDTGARTYMNILLHDSLIKGAFLARELGREQDAVRFEDRAHDLRRAINDLLWDGESGFFRLSKAEARLGQAAGALALAVGFATSEQAERMVPQLGYMGHGKFQSLMVRGKLRYGYAEAALADFFAHNWARISEQTDVPWTVTECMHFPQGGWGDESHPDTAVAHLFTGFVLGVQPTGPGYRTYEIAPQPVSCLGWTRGVVPTPRGDIRAGWSLDHGVFALDLKLPMDGGTVILPCRGLERYSVSLNGDPVWGAGVTDARTPAGIGRLRESDAGLRLEDVAPGDWHIEIRAVQGEFTAGDPDAVAAADRDWGANARSSHETGDWGVSRLIDGVTASRAGSKGYSSEGAAGPDVEEWVEVDLGRERVVKKVTLWPRTDTPGVDGGVAGFPSDFQVELRPQAGPWRTVHRAAGATAPDAGHSLEIDLYTVVGYPTARHVRVSVTRLGTPAVDEPDVYRFQLAELELVLDQ